MFGRAARPLVTAISTSCPTPVASIVANGFFEKVGLDYVSCSPYRVPVARLAAAQAVLQAKR